MYDRFVWGGEEHTFKKLHDVKWQEYGWDPEVYLQQKVAYVLFTQ